MVLSHILMETEGLTIYWVNLLLIDLRIIQNIRTMKISSNLLKDIYKNHKPILNKKRIYYKKSSYLVCLLINSHSNCQLNIHIEMVSITYKIENQELNIMIRICKLVLSGKIDCEKYIFPEMLLQHSPTVQIAKKITNNSPCSHSITIHLNYWNLVLKYHEKTNKISIFIYYFN